MMRGRDGLVEKRWEGLRIAVCGCWILDCEMGAWGLMEGRACVLVKGKGCETRKKKCVCVCVVLIL